MDLKEFFTGMPHEIFWELFDTMEDQWKTRGEALAYAACVGIISKKHARQCVYLWKKSPWFSDFITAYTQTKNKLLKDQNNGE